MLPQDDMTVSLYVLSAVLTKADNHNCNLLSGYEPGDEEKLCIGGEIGEIHKINPENLVNAKMTIS
jgi:hypothetical protein